MPAGGGRTDRAKIRVRPLPVVDGITLRVAPSLPSGTPVVTLDRRRLPIAGTIYVQGGPGVSRAAMIDPKSTV
jgi:hypothetical protein